MIRWEDTGREARVTHYAYLPLIQILWSKELKDELSFLKDNKLVGRRIVEAHKAKEEELGVYVIPFGNLRWKWNDDKAIYITQLKNQIQAGMPVRPIVALEPYKIKWKALEKTPLVEQISATTSTVRIYPQLIAEVEKGYSIANVEEKNLMGTIKTTERIFENELHEHKMAILKGLFKDFSNIRTRYADDVVTIVEIKQKLKNKNDLETKLLEKTQFFEEEIAANIHRIEYYSPKPKVLLRKRLKKAIQIAHMVNTLLQHTSVLLETQKLDELTFSQRKEFIEYILNQLDPKSYFSARNNNSFLVPLNYQRRIVKRIFANKKAQKTFRAIVKYIQKTMLTWESHELLIVRMLKGRNVVDLRYALRSRIVIDKPPLEPVHEILLEFMISMLKKQIQEMHPFVLEQKMPQLNSLFSLSLHQVYSNFNSWLTRTSYPKDVLTVNRIKENPKLLIDLEKKGLVLVLDSPGRAAKRYIVNLAHPYIKKRIIG